MTTADLILHAAKKAIQQHFIWCGYSETHEKYKIRTGKNDHSCEWCKENKEESCFRRRYRYAPKGFLKYLVEKLEEFPNNTTFDTFIKKAGEIVHVYIRDSTVHDYVWQKRRRISKNPITPLVYLDEDRNFLLSDCPIQDFRDIQQDKRVRPERRRRAQKKFSTIPEDGVQEKNVSSLGDISRVEEGACEKVCSVA